MIVFWIVHVFCEGVFTVIGVWSSLYSSEILLIMLFGLIYPYLFYYLPNLSFPEVGRLKSVICMFLSVSHCISCPFCFITVVMFVLYYTQSQWLSSHCWSWLLALKDVLCHIKHFLLEFYIFYIQDHSHFTIFICNTPQSTKILWAHHSAPGHTSTTCVKYHAVIIHETYLFHWCVGFLFLF